jgi:hypothetical protein
LKLLNIAAAALAPALAATLLCCAPAFAQDKTAQDKFGEDKNKVEFARVQEECVQSAEITFGPQGRWQSCTVTRTGFVATIGLQDFYYAHYCLGPTAAGCKRQAQVVFRNRAYRPEAFVEMVRIDPPGTRYDIPLLIGTDTEGALAAGGAAEVQLSLEGGAFRILDMKLARAAK